MLLDILFKFGLDLRVYWPIQRQDNWLLFTCYLRMSTIVHCLYQYYIVLLFYYLPFTNLIFHLAEENNTDKLGSFFIVVDDVVSRVVFSLQIVEKNILNYIG